MTISVCVRSSPRGGGGQISRSLRLRTGGAHSHARSLELNTKSPPRPKTVQIWGYVRVLPFPRQCVRRGQLTGQMQSWYQDLLEDRLTHCGHSLDAEFRLTADRSNPLVALKRSTRIVDRLEP